VQSRVRFNRVPEKVPGGFGAEQVSFNKVPEKVPEKKVPEKVWEALVQGPSSSTGCRRRSQVRFNTVPKKVPEKVWEALVQVRFNRVPEKVPDKVLGRLGCRAWSGSTGFRRRFRRRSGRLWCRARSGLTGFAAI